MMINLRFFTRKLAFKALVFQPGDEKLEIISMKNQILMLVYISVGVGIFTGMLIVLLLSIFRRKQVINSLISPQDFWGLPGTLEVPFDTHSRGKIRRNVKGHKIEIVARTE